MTKKIAIPYQLFRWGPCLVKLSISKENQELFLKEAKASKTDFETVLLALASFKKSSWFSLEISSLTRHGPQRNS